MRTIHVAVALALIAAGCHAPVETKQNHIVHKGEMARLLNAGQETVYMAAEKGGSDALVTAVDAQTQAGIDALVTAGRAVAVEAGTPVRVIGEAFNEREVEVAEGPQKSKRGWVPFEWLKPM